MYTNQWWGQDFLLGGRVRISGEACPQKFLNLRCSTIDLQLFSSPMQEGRREQGSQSIISPNREIQ